MKMIEDALIRPVVVCKMAQSEDDWGSSRLGTLCAGSLMSLGVLDL